MVLFFLLLYGLFILRFVYLYSFLISRIRYFLRDVWHGFKTWFKFFFRLAFLPFKKIYKLFKRIPKLMRYWRFFRTLEWVYTSWLYVYTIHDNDYDQQANSTTIDSESYDYAEEEFDPQADAGIDGDEDGDYNFDRLTEVPFPWSVWWNSPTLESVDEVDFIDDTFVELFYDELYYMVSLTTRPFLDFFVNLPVWGILRVGYLVITYR